PAPPPPAGPAIPIQAGPTNNAAAIPNRDKDGTIPRPPVAAPRTADQDRLFHAAETGGPALIRRRDRHCCRLADRRGNDEHTAATTAAASIDLRIADRLDASANAPISNARCRESPQAQVASKLQGCFHR